MASSNVSVGHVLERNHDPSNGGLSEADKRDLKRLRNKVWIIESEANRLEHSNGPSSIAYGSSNSRSKTLLGIHHRDLSHGTKD